MKKKEKEELNKSTIEFTWTPAFNEQWNEFEKDFNPSEYLIKTLKTTAETFFGHGYYTGKDAILELWENTLTERERKFKKTKKKVIEK